MATVIFKYNHHYTLPWLLKFSTNCRILPFRMRIVILHLFTWEAPSQPNCLGVPFLIFFLIIICHGCCKIFSLSFIVPFPILKLAFRIIVFEFVAKLFASHLISVRFAFLQSCARKRAANIGTTCHVVHELSLHSPLQKVLQVHYDTYHTCVCRLAQTPISPLFSGVKLSDKASGAQHFQQHFGRSVKFIFAILWLFFIVTVCLHCLTLRGSILGRCPAHH